MTDEQDKPGSSGEADNEPKRPAAGERLAEARRERQISVHDVAKQLHLDEAKVRALERNDFDVLGAPVFAKGHLRKYAELVGIEKDDIISDFYRMTHMADLPPVVHNRPRLRQQVSPLPWAIAIVLVAVAAALGYWWFIMEDGGAGFFGGPVDDAPFESTTVESRPVESRPIESRPVESVAVGGPPADEPITVVETATESADAVPMPEPQSELPSAALPREQEPAAAGQTRLSVRFSGDCWTEISDANDARLFFDMGRAGRSVELAGTAPFSILFGNSENVRLNVNGADYPISPNTPGSRTARFTVMKP